ncbi:MAG: FAD-dependent oxidoreductase [Acidobacteria bacterium]|nr:FAD-dependent oxidoreductase [Acidobacteriota bacterium]MCB9397092.1 FAD-dependent oxidoreductase [Acidobacteriota bacterium]
MSANRLKQERLEQQMKDKKPLYTPAEAVYEANRCLYCYDAPCIKACPTGIDIPRFIKKIATDNIPGSAKTIFSANMLGYSCARVCPVEVLCVGACVYNDLNHQPIEIGRLQRYATEKALGQEKESGKKLFTPQPKTDKKVALVGAGPASLACAAYLALSGVQCDLYEKNELPGGLNTTGVAPYKLFALDAMDEVNWILQHGINLKTRMALGENITLDALCDSYDAVFLGLGLGADRALLDHPAVWGATDLIAKIKNDPDFQLPHTDSAVVIGGGNTALDIARELAYLGVKDVLMVYRKGIQDMSGYRHEREAAMKQGVRFMEFGLPKSLTTENGLITGLTLTFSNGLPDFEISTPFVIEAVGQEKHGQNWGLKTEKDGTLSVDPRTFETSRSGVFAGGDCVNGGKEVVNAAAEGRDAAFAMLKRWNIPSQFLKEV